MQKKVCSGCTKEKNLRCFSPMKHGKYGVASRCKVCMKAYSKKYRELNYDKIKTSDEIKRFIKMPLHKTVRFKQQVMPKRTRQMKEYFNLPIETKRIYDYNARAEIRDSYIRQIFYRKGIKNPSAEEIEKVRTSIKNKRALGKTAFKKR